MGESAHGAADRPATLVVLAKEPVPGRVKTRLQPDFTAREAAGLAGCAIEDTLHAVRASRATRKVLAWDGDPRNKRNEFEIVAQPSGSLNDRLVAAFATMLAHGPTPVLLIGMDTPQVTAPLLDTDWEGADAVLGLSEDGGFWAIGLRRGDPQEVFDGIPMSTDRTGAAQLARLHHLGRSVRLLPPLRDVDTAADADHVSRRYPWLSFSRRHRELVDGRAEQTAEQLFDRVFSGGGASVCSTVDALDLDVARWSGDADVVDLMVVSRCEPPVVDLGCGPGRMVVALARSGRPALGVDLSAEAVATTMQRGGLALHRRVDDPLPGEGRWGTALLVDSNIGMGGDLDALLRRCRDLVTAGGLVICEVDATPDRDEVHAVVLAGDGRTSVPLPWGRVGAATLARSAASLDLRVAEEWSAGGRVFVTLRKS
jgi:rSAM/selenodomain-associated transferase 1